MAIASGPCHVSELTPLTARPRTAPAYCGLSAA
jgi:hypothetical protein